MLKKKRYKRRKVIIIYMTYVFKKATLFKTIYIYIFSINLLVVYRESVNLIGYITRRLSADSHQLRIANENRSSIYFDQTRSFKF